MWYVGVGVSVGGGGVVVGGGGGGGGGGWGDKQVYICVHCTCIQQTH